MSDSLDERAAEMCGYFRAHETPKYKIVENLIIDLDIALKKSEAENARLREDAGPDGWKGIAQKSNIENAGLLLENKRLRELIKMYIDIEEVEESQAKECGCDRCKVDLELLKAINA